MRISRNIRTTVTSLQLTHHGFRTDLWTARRVICLEGQALEIVKRLLPDAKAKLFVNWDSAAWASFALNCRFHRLKDTLGERFSPYLFQHGLAIEVLPSQAHDAPGLWPLLYATMARVPYFAVSFLGTSRTRT